jgi:hypothetical protein
MPDPDAGNTPPALEPPTDSLPPGPPPIPPIPPPPAYPKEPELPPPSGRSMRITLALIVPNLLALALMWLTKYLLDLRSGGSDQSGVYILADFVLIPLLMGLTAAFCIRDLRLGVGWSLLLSLGNTIIGIALSYFVLKEGYLCLIVVSPLLFGFIALGGLLGRLMFRPRYRTLQLSLVPVLMILLVADGLAPHNHHNAVTDVVTINAPPERVWQFIPGYPAIQQSQEPLDYWFFRLGLPAPTQSTSSGAYVGAERRCAFQGGAVLGEKIVECEPNKKLTFDVTEQIKDPEIMGHITAERGQFLLKDNGDGTTTLIGTSWYSLHVYPSTYYDFWAQDIIRHVHLRVMNHVKMLAEAPDVTGLKSRSEMQSPPARTEVQPAQAGFAFQNGVSTPEKGMRRQ